MAGDGWADGLGLAPAQAAVLAAVRDGDARLRHSLLSAQGAAAVAASMAWQLQAVENDLRAALAELDVAAPFGQNTDGEGVVLVLRRQAFGGDVVILVLHDRDVATGKVEFTLGSDLVFGQFIDDRDGQLQIHGDSWHWGPDVLAGDGRGNYLGRA